jgi:hypothetical protein
MTEDSRAFDAPARQAAEDRAIIDHLVKTFHADPDPQPAPRSRGQVSARIRRQWTPESRAMLGMM